MSSFDKLTIETPEQTALEFPLAGIGSRFLALAADTLLQLAAAWIVIMIFAVSAISLSLFSKVAGIWTFAIMIFILFSVQFGYFALFEALWNGQTPGKRWTHLRVIKDSGRPISAYDAILRNLLRIVDALPTMYATGLITMLISQREQACGRLRGGHRGDTREAAARRQLDLATVRRLRHSPPLRASFRSSPSKSCSS